MIFRINKKYKYSQLTSKIVEFAMKVHGALGNGLSTSFANKNVISVELKAIIKLEEVYLTQAINYLEAYNLTVELLINFGEKSLCFKRFTNKKYEAALSP